MCNCKQETEAAFVKAATEQLPKSTQIKAEVGGYVLGISPDLGTVVEKPAAQVTIKHTVESKTGPKQKTIKQFLFAKFCPFCGVKL